MIQPMEVELIAGHKSERRPTCSLPGPPLEIRHRPTIFGEVERAVKPLVTNQSATDQFLACPVL